MSKSIQGPAISTKPARQVIVAHLRPSPTDDGHAQQRRKGDGFREGTMNRSVHTFAGLRLAAAATALFLGIWAFSSAAGGDDHRRLARGSWRGRHLRAARRNHRIE